LVSLGLGAAISGLFLLAAVAFYWEIALPGRILADYDVWTYFYPLRSYAAEAIRAGRFPLWNPDTFLGAPFFANPQTALLYPGTIIFYLLPVAYAYSVSVILHVFLAAAFMYALLRSSFRVGVAAAIVGASAFAFGGFVSAQVGHVNQLSASAWLPAIVLAADAALRRRSIRWTALAGVAVAVQLLAGHAQESYMTLWVLAIFLGWRALNGSAEPRALTSESSRARAARTMTRIGRDAAVAVAVGCGVGLLGFGVAATQLLPTLELSSESIRAGGMSFTEATSFSLIPPLLVRSLLPGYWYNVFSEYMGYVGATALGFAAIAIAFGPLRVTLCAAALAFVGLFFAVGVANPLYPLAVEHVPGMDLFRVPARWLFVYTFGAATLAAIGVHCSLDRSWVRASSVRALLAGVLIGGVVIAALPLIAAVPGRIVLLWICGLTASLSLALLAVRWPTPVVAAAIAAIVLGELRLAALDLPQRHAVPTAVIEETRPVAAYLQRAHEGGRILSIAPTEYETGDHAEIDRRFGDLEAKPLTGIDAYLKLIADGWNAIGAQVGFEILPPASAASFALKSALKLDEVMSPNVPLRYGISTLDGYDGGVLPLARYLRIASLLAPATEIRADGVLRTRLIAIPDQPLLRLFDIRRIVANEVVDVDLSGLRYDVATARRLQPSDQVRVDLPAPVAVKALWLLNSATSDPRSSLELGETVLVRSDGTRETLPLNYGEAIFDEMGPGPSNAFQPTAGLSVGGRTDTAVEIPVPDGEPITAIEWTWFGPGTWNLRAATLETNDGAQLQLLLQPGLQKIVFSPIKVYERMPDTNEPPQTVRLFPHAEVLDDDAALSKLRSTPDGDPRLALAAGSALPANPPEPEPGALFRRLAGAPERLTYQRTSGAGAGYLLVDDAWFPGWRAEVDGQTTPIYRANVHFKAVWVPASGRTVTLIYEPSSVRLGAIISAGAAALTVLLLLRGRLR